MVKPMLAATAQGTALACASNVVGQYVDAYRSGHPFVFDWGQLIRFLIQSLIVIPPNWYWQLFLERAFPARPKLASTDDIGMEERNAGVRKSEDEPQADGERDHFIGSSQTQGQPAPLSIKNTAAKWFIDCMTVGAILNTTAFLVIIGFLKGYSTHEVATSVRTETIPIIVASYKIWPVASIINFAYIPVERRILFLSSVSFCWSIYLSIVAARI